MRSRNSGALSRMSMTIIQKYWRLIAERHDAEAFAALDRRYREPHRSYHSWGHISDMLHKLDDLTHLAMRADLIAAAVFWHDAVYTTRASDGRPRCDAENVWDSAALFQRHASFPAGERDAIVELILATSNHLTAQPSGERYRGFGHDHGLFLDIDLSSLAAPWPVFEANLHRIRFEYSWIPEEEFFIGHRRMLEAFAGCDSLFRRRETTARWLDAARANLRRAQAELGDRVAAKVA
jgi:predicted metal-dependent HD superfamily phosphohydrolase